MHWVSSIPLYVNSHNFLGFTNAITKCSQLHPNAPLSHRRPSMRETNVRQIIVRSILREAESILTVDEYATAACTGESLS